MTIKKYLDKKEGQLTSLIIEHGWVIPVEGTAELIPDGAVAVEGNRIVGVGLTGEIRSRFGPADTVINAKGQVVVPGFINTHTHLVGALHKGMSEDVSGLSGGLFTVIHPLHQRYVRREDVYWPAFIHAVEMLKTGTTCINETWWFQSECAKCARDLGIRAVLAEAIREVPLGGLGPKNLERNWDKRLGEESFEAAVKLIDEWHGKENGRITCRVAPMAPDRCSEALLARCKNLAETHRLGYHVHLAQIPGEREFIEHAYGKGPVEFMRDTGLLGPNFIGVHCVFMNPEEVQIMAETGAHMSHTAYLVAKRAYFPPMPSIYRAGVSVSLGSDWASNDMFKIMRTAILLARHQAAEVGILDAKRALYMATLGGAKALGLEAEIGSLAPGKKADIAVIDLRTAWCNPIRTENIVSNLVYNANGSDVSNVIVDGRILVRDHRLTVMDEEKVLSEGQRVAEEVWQRASSLFSLSSSQGGKR